MANKRRAMKPQSWGRSIPCAPISTTSRCRFHASAAVQRSLAANLAADIVGSPMLTITEDGALTEFDSAVDAVMAGEQS